VRTFAGKDPASYDFVMQIDLDSNGTYSSNNFPGVMEPGGGFALQACDTCGKFGAINIWSSVPDILALPGGLTMDFNHELSHMFGMMDDWPFLAGSTGPVGSVADDWIPYVMFGWTDTDGDGIPEILDATPHGTSGPQAPIRASVPQYVPRCRGTREALWINGLADDLEHPPLRRAA
jgi:hypothetical protein